MRQRMNPPSEERQAETSAALQLMLHHVGDRRISESFFDRTQPPFNTLSETTWSELQESNCAIPFFDSKHFRLTGNGWLRALRESGATKEKVFRRNGEKLISAIKKRVKGMQPGTRMIAPQVLAQDSRLPESFISNAVESNLIEAEFNQRGVTWAHGFEGKMIHVPIEFGQEL